ncbi:tetratricopeptide repeat protein [Engelhardtia mirabilis]|uniref:Tol-pal system protein YbgF n=1 Tax=Engelhardtia mirabilis TaxID=2528011 RepID=A0A518BGB4_9BACT|nr:tol-pal system protein YbgF [Planctomycetes bacterium Pla133]QDV00312.1 tol-pal system protein YbgF [Planctomycetes bacterium Pla86]
MSLALGALALGLASLGTPAPPDADEDYQYLAGLAQRGLHELVVPEARKFIGEYPSDSRLPQARYRLGDALFALDRFEESLAEFERLDRVTGFDLAFEVDLRRGQCQLELGRPELAIEPLRSVADGGPQYLDRSATFLLAEALLRSGDAERADRRYAEVLEDGGGDLAADAWHGRVWCAFDAGRHADCAERAAEFLRRFESDPRADEVRFLAAESDLERGQAERALAGFLAVRSGDQVDAALRGAGFAAAALDRHDEAAGHFAALLERFPDSRFAAECALHRGIALLRAQRVDQARGALDDPRVPAGAEAEYWRARASAAAADHAAALSHAEAGLRTRPEGEVARRLQVARGDALLALGRNAEAADAFEAGGGGYALYSAAVAHLEDGRAEEALALAQRVAAGGGEEASAAAVLVAEAQLALQRFDQAEQSFAALVQKEGDAAERARLSVRLGWARMGRGDAAAAREAFLVGTRAPEGSDVLPEATFMAARCADELDRGEEAIDGYATFLERWPAAGRRTEALVRLARLVPGEDGERLLESAARDAGELGLRARFDLAERLSDRGELALARGHYAALVGAQIERELRQSSTYGLAWCELNLGEVAAAAARLDALARERDVEPELKSSALELLVWAARSSGDAAATREAYARFAATKPDDARLLAAARLTSAALTEAGATEAALTLLGEANRGLASPEAKAGALVEAAWVRLDAGEVERAEAELAQARKLAPANASLAEASFFVGEARFERGEDEAAAADYALAAPHLPAELAPALLYKWGFAELRRGNSAAAEARFAQLLAQHPDSELVGETLFLVGEARFRDERFEQAIAPLEQVLAEHPRHQVVPKARFRLGVAASRAGRHERAAEVLGELARRNPDFEHLAEADLWRGRSLAALAQTRAARACFDRVIAADDGVLSARARIELGRLDTAAGELDAALSHFLKVAVLYALPEEVAEALFLAGQVLEAQDRADLAKARYVEASEKYPQTAFGVRAAERLAAMGSR